MTAAADPLDELAEYLRGHVQFHAATGATQISRKFNRWLSALTQARTDTRLPW